ncbi:hypothetical protein A7U60_g1857 [Sanghuangporus baumii]|uniref:DUF6533 domain-containing protein n=1 Tax=Sanghuangporus baumii TaxID=108892 RepID=A0A9Q5I397_SANBA|nr:hypothetical protein A7U60_g1857 [Sanghuangporus baumii]
MSTLGEEIQLLQQVALDLQTSRVCRATALHLFSLPHMLPSVASFVVLAWDILISLQDEIYLIWKAKWTAGKVLYLACRYPILMEAVVWLAYTLDFSASSSFCSVAAYLDGWSTLVFIIPATDIIMATSIALVNKSLVFKANTLIQPVFGCDSGLVSLNTTVTTPAWAALMGFDTAIFLLTLTKVIAKIRHGRTPLLTVLVRDGFAYYTFMLATSVGNLIIYTALPATRHGLLNSMLQVLRSTMSITGARILLNVRGVISTTQESWSQATDPLEICSDSSSSSNNTTAAIDSIELCPPVLVIGRADA